jgi:hypothetical protein
MRLVGQLSLVGAAMKSSARNAALAPGKGAGSSWRRWGATRLSLAGGFCPARGFAESSTTRARPIPNFPPLRVSLEGNIASGEATSSPRIPSSSEMCSTLGQTRTFCSHHRVDSTREEHPPWNTRQQVSTASRPRACFKMAKRDEVACYPLPSPTPISWPSLLQQSLRLHLWAAQTKALTIRI